MVDKPNKLQPAVIGGLIIGILWSIPFLNLLNFCCCIGVLIGGAIAANLLIKRSPVFPVTSGDGAMVGLLAGAIGAGVYLVIGVPLSLLFSDATVGMLERISESVNDPGLRGGIEEMIRQSQNQSAGQRFISAIFSWLVISMISMGFSTLGGVIGVALFEKRKGQTPPPTAGYTPGGPAGYPPPGPPPTAPPGQGPFGGSEPPRY